MKKYHLQKIATAAVAIAVLLGQTPQAGALTFDKTIAAPGAHVSANAQQPEVGSATSPALSIYIAGGDGGFIQGSGLQVADILSNRLGAAALGRGDVRLLSLVSQAVLPVVSGVSGGYSINIHLPALGIPRNLRYAISTGSAADSCAAALASEPQSDSHVGGCRVPITRIVASAAVTKPSRSEPLRSSLTFNLLC
jgi:hypothetical protein